MVVKRRTIRAVILAVWTLLMAWVIRFEAFPEYFTHTLAGYRGLLSDDVLVEDNWMLILFNEHPIGYSHTSIEVDETDPVKYYTVDNRMFVRLKAMGFEQPIFVDTVAHIDIAHALQRFTFELSSRDYAMKIAARRAGDSRFVGYMDTGQARQQLDFQIPDGVVLYSPMTEMALKALKPGQELTVRTLDPATLTTAAMTVRALRREPLIVGGVTNETTLLSTDYQGLTVQSWLGDNGTLLRQETPFGWTLVACTAEEAFETIDAEGYTGDVIAELAVRCIGTIARPRAARQLTLRVSGAPLSAAAFESRRQTVGPVDGDGFDLVVRAERFPQPGTDAGATGDERAPYLADTMYVQAAHPDMIRQARRIVAGLTSDRARAEAIYTWVYENVRKEIKVSLPSALEVLRTLAGDCNEHTYLFTALARAVGLPTKIMAGIAYAKDRFYYHAWPAVYLGEWVEMDPTWGQPTVDATHIRFTEGELNNQVDLIKLVGRLQIEVLAEE